MILRTSLEDPVAGNSNLGVSPCLLLRKDREMTPEKTVPPKGSTGKLSAELVFAMAVGLTREERVKFLYLLSDVCCLACGRKLDDRPCYCQNDE